MEAKTKKKPLMRLLERSVGSRDSANLREAGHAFENLVYPRHAQGLHAQTNGLGFEFRRRIPLKYGRTEFFPEHHDFIESDTSFEAVVETLSNPNTPMSIEAKVDEMWGDSKDKSWKDEEVKRIKEQQGIAVLDEPALANPIEEVTV